ncbi:MAG: hypothetical protein CIT03_02895 [Methanobacterium sp.]|nr:MAG: hypothetical protein CIT03_02895 [Methanobacterium sp.]
MSKIPKNEETMLKCICSSCSSYTKCMEEGTLGVFCSVGDAKNCLQDVVDCNCSECSVPSSYGFSSSFHCRDGSADQQ